MRKSTESKLLFWTVLATLIFLLVVLCISLYKDIKAGQIETFVNEYPFWAVSASGDSTFQTVQIIKCWEVFPNGQRELRGYKVTVDSSGYRIYEEESVWFLNWAVFDALRLQVRLGKQKGTFR